MQQTTTKVADDCMQMYFNTLQITTMYSDQIFDRIVTSTWL